MPAASRAIFMGKDKPSTIAALRHLVETGVEVACVVAPDTGGLAHVARDLELPLATDTALYDRLAGDPAAAPGVGPLDDIDLVLSFLFWKRIRLPLIALPRIGCINFHPAPLPDFRGLGGYNVAILEALPRWGVSAHFVDEAFDTGDLIRVDRFPIDPAAETVRSLEQQSQHHLLELFRAVMAMVRAGDALPRAPQGEGRYIDREEFKRMKRVEPDDPPELIERKVRAFWYPPYPGAYITLGGRRYTLVSDELLSSGLHGSA